MKRIALTLMAILLLASPVFSQIVSIPDTAFLKALIDEGVDVDGDSLVSYAEAEKVTYLDVGVSNFLSRNITDMTGIEAFINVDTLICSRNQLSSLNVSKNTSLIKLDCGENQLANLDVSGCKSLTYLDCSSQFNDDIIPMTYHLTSLNVSNNPALSELYCLVNLLTTLDVSKNTALTVLECWNNQLTSLDVSSCKLLTYLDCAGQRDGDLMTLTSLDISNNPALTLLICAENLISILDVSNVSLRPPTSSRI